MVYIRRALAGYQQGLTNSSTASAGASHGRRFRRLSKQRRDGIGIAQAPSGLHIERVDQESLAGRSGGESSFSLIASSTTAR